MTTTDGERGAFETFISTVTDPDRLKDRLCWDAERAFYEEWSTEIAWLAWQARAALSSDREMAPEAKAKDSVNQTGALRQEPVAADGEHALSARLMEFANELDAEATSGAQWSKAQHTCVSVGGALRDVAKAVAELEDTTDYLAAALRKEVEAPTFDPEGIAPPGRIVAWVCTDYDGRADVGMTKESAKERAGAHCTEFFGLVPALASSAHIAQRSAE